MLKTNKLTKSELSCGGGRIGVARNGLTVSVMTFVETTMSVDTDSWPSFNDVIK